nr:uncharacterized protein LOC129380792 [Dermacentor andersoni]
MAVMLSPRPYRWQYARKLTIWEKLVTLISQVSFKPLQLPCLNYEVVDLSWTGPALSAGSSAAQRCCQLLKMAVILHDNARQHVAIRTANKLRSFHGENLDHPPYSPDLAPCDFHVLSPLKKFLARQRSPCNNKAKTALGLNMVFPASFEYASWSWTKLDTV